MGEETLEHAMQRTTEFIALLDSEITVLSMSRDDEPFIAIIERMAPLFTSPLEHFEAREQLAGCFSSIAYKALVRKWSGSTPAAPAPIA